MATQNEKRDRGTEGKGDSKYAIKRASGKMMYGPGCCGHGTRRKQTR